MDILNTELPKYGINIKLDTYNNMLAEFTKLISLKKPLINTFYKFEYDFASPKDFELRNDTKNKKYKFISHLASGTFNSVSTYLDVEKNENVIVRFSGRYSIKYHDEIENLFKTFYENLKHIILYILIRHYIGNCKFIPKPYYFLSDVATGLGYFEFIMIMEKGELTLEKYLESNTDMRLIRKIFYSVYKDLCQLDFIKFRHGDLKVNNIVMSKKLNPLLIDFGFSQFIINDPNKGPIKFENLDDINPKYNPYYKESYYNQVHDIMQLLTSINFIHTKKPRDIDPYTVFEFIKNKKMNILDGILMKKKLSVMFPNPKVNEYSPNLYAAFYNNSDFSLYDLFESDILKEKPNLIAITPEQLAENIGIDPKDYMVETYEQKYLKYKMKYLKLKMLYQLN